MKWVDAKCMLCGKVYELGEEDINFKKMADPDKPGTYVCDRCANKVRYESDDKMKHPKPTSN